MSTQEFASSSRREPETLPDLPVPAAPQAAAQKVDDLLDEIDSILVTNAESFVQGFVQKGGQ
ncbi:MAG: ubiquitin-like protein Pup [Actinomycetales bacterium]|jgi:Pup-like protein.|nr:ubiquitin-like protein Pup [Actinomycetales bacterium]